MGGPGSGNWPRTDKKRTVEESLVLSMGEFCNRLNHPSSGEFTWRWSGERKASVGYVLTLNDTPTITLHYRWRDSEDVRIPIRLRTTMPKFGGQRSWFTCPLIVGGTPCLRRAGKLYLPSGEKYFGCRMCHDLTYRSSQEAHQLERLFGRFIGASNTMKDLMSNLRNTR